MGERVVRFSDLSGQMADNPEALAGIVVTEHPELDQPVRLEAMPQELEQLGKLALKDPVVLDITMPGEEEAKRFVLTAASFGKLALGRPMSEVLENAQPVVPPKPQRRSHNTTASGEPLVNYSTLENAGLPHKGKVGPEEARLVRENLEAVNAKRAVQDLPPIDPSNPIDAKRYGFEAGEPATDA